MTKLISIWQFADNTLYHQAVPDMIQEKWVPSQRVAALEEKMVMVVVMFMVMVIIVIIIIIIRIHRDR